MDSEPNNGAGKPEDGTNEQEDSAGGAIPYPDVPLLLVGFDETPPAYASEVYISTDPAGLQFVFTRFLPPPVLTEADRRRILDRGHYDHEVVARVVLPSAVVEAMLQRLPERLATQLDQERAYLESIRAFSATSDGSEENGSGSE